MYSPSLSENFDCDVGREFATNESVIWGGPWLVAAKNSITENANF